MKSLSEDLQTPKRNLDKFADVTKRVLDYLPNIVSKRVGTRDYTILSSVVAGTTKFARPVNNNLFINKIEEFEKSYKLFLQALKQIKNGKKIKRKDYSTIDSVVYTIQQSIGVGMDFLCNPNSARKHVGNRFEELIRNIVSQAGITNDKVVFKLYSCETDIILSPHERVKSNIKTINEDEIVISLKTTSKDRMGKIFLDKLLMQKFAEHPVKVVGIFLNDVQRKETEKISYTFVSGLFMVYTKFLTRLEGVYFVDPPPITKDSPYNEHISPFSKFIADDMWELLAS
jgi:hypothetical protein